MIATLFLLVLGCYICAANRKLAVALLAGGAVVVPDSTAPELQIIAGMIGIGVGQVLGHATLVGDDNPARITSEFGGFVVTFVTGGILMAGSVCPRAFCFNGSSISSAGTPLSSIVTLLRSGRETWLYSPRHRLSLSPSTPPSRNSARTGKRFALPSFVCSTARSMTFAPWITSITRAGPTPPVANPAPPWSGATSSRPRRRSAGTSTTSWAGSSSGRQRFPFVIWPFGRVYESRRSCEPQFGKYRWLLDWVLVNCVGHRLLDPDDERRLVGPA